MDSKRTRISGGILALFAATVLACGTIQGASGKAGSTGGGGDNYLTANDSYGVGARNTTIGSGGTGIAADGFGPAFQP